MRGTWVKSALGSIGLLAERGVERAARRSFAAVTLRLVGVRVAAHLLLAAAVLFIPGSMMAPGEPREPTPVRQAGALTAPALFAPAPAAPAPAATVQQANALALPALAAPAQAAAPAAAQASQPLVSAVDSVTLTVSDADRSAEFFAKVLSFEKVSDVEVTGEDVERLQGVFGTRLRVVRMRLGEESINLQEYVAPRGRPVPVDSRSNDLWFQHVAIIVSDMDRAYAWLRKNRVEHASPGPQRLPDWNQAAGGIEAFYFKDPDGHALEILEFPAGKGDPRWQRKGERLFLGIDHTAIAVADTEASLRFYRDALGMRVAGESENYGPEQERLNNVFGARLRITALRAAEGPGVELLEYLAPGDGRPRPADARPNDLIHWQTRLRVADAEAAARALRGAGSKGDAVFATGPGGESGASSGSRPGFISPGAVPLTQAASDLGIRGGLTLSDPDGHALQLVETSSASHRQP